MVLTEELRELSPAFVVGGYDPPQDGIFVQENPPERLAVSRINRLPREYPGEGAAQRPPANHSEGIVQPDQTGGPLPDYVPHLRVVPVSHPPFRNHGLIDQFPEIFGGSLNPIGHPVQGVQFDVGNVQLNREPPGEAGLARATTPNDHHPLQDGGRLLDLLS